MRRPDRTFPTRCPRSRAAEPPALPVPKLSALEAKYVANVRQVTHGLPRAGEGYFSRDSKSIVYQAYPVGYPFYQIYTQSLEKGDPRSSGMRLM